MPLLLPPDFDPLLLEPLLFFEPLLLDPLLDELPLPDLLLLLLSFFCVGITSVLLIYYPGLWPQLNYSTRT